MPINAKTRDDSHRHQVFAVKQLGMNDDVCSIHISKGGEAIKQMRRETSSCLHFYDFFYASFLIVLKAIKKISQ
jgi:hypothetical protein